MTTTRQPPPTLSSLGRASARPSMPLPVLPDPPPPPERGGVLRRGLRAALFDNTRLKFLSLVLASTLWLLVNTDKDREITARVAVSYMLPEEKVLVSDRVDEVRVTIKGPWRRLRKFDEREIDRINLDLRRATTGEIAISPDMVQLPSGLSVTSINPRSMHVTFDRRVEKVVEVVPAVTGRPQHGFFVADITPIPKTVKLRGGAGTLAALQTIRTSEVNVEGRTEMFSDASELLPPVGVEVLGNSQIAVQIRIDEELVTRKLPGVGVLIKGDGDLARWRTTPAQIDVTLTGALLAIERARGTLVLVVTAVADPRAATRPREVEVTVEGVPPGVGVKLSPERVRLTAVKPTAPAPSPAPR